jgi:hypothetical protein
VLCMVGVILLLAVSSNFVLRLKVAKGIEGHNLFE